MRSSRTNPFAKGNEERKQEVLKNIKDYEIPVFPDLPESRGFKGRVKKICKRVYSGNKQEVRSRMKQIAKGSDERGE